MKLFRKTVQSILIAALMMLVSAPYGTVKAEGEGTESYNLWVGNVQVTSGNKDDILRDGGKAKYDPETGTLTFASPSLPTGLQKAVYSKNLDLTIKGDAKLNASVYGIYAEGGSLTVEDGNITINVKGGDTLAGIRAGTKISIKGGSLNITAESTGGVLCDASGFRSGSVNISKGTVEINVVNSYHSRGIEADTVISGGDMTIDSYGLYADGISEGAFTMSDGKLQVVSKSRDYGYGIHTLWNNTITVTGGELSVTCEGASNTYGSSALNADGGISISGGKITAKAYPTTGHDAACQGIVFWTGGQPTQEIIISGGEIEASGSGDNSSGIYTDQKVTITGGKVDSKGTDIGISCAGTLTIGNGIVSVAAKGGESGIYSMDSISLGDELTIQRPDNGKLSEDKKTIVDSSGNHATDVLIVNNNKYTITVNDSENGSVTSSRLKANNGDEIVLTVEPDPDCKLESISVTDGDGNEVSLTETDSGYKFNMPESDVTVTAVFARYYSISIDEDSKAYIEIDQTEEAAGRPVTVKLIEVEGYLVKEIKITDAQGNNVEVDENNTFDMPASDVTVTATVVRLYTITVNESENGSVTAGADEAEAGDPVVLTVSPEEDCQLDSISVKDDDGTEVDLTETDSGYEFDMPASNVTVSAVFIRYYSVSVPDDLSDYLSVDSEKAAAGETVTITLKDVEGYAVKDITITDEEGNKVEVNEDNTFIMPASAVTISAEVVKVFTLTFDLDGGTYQGKSTYTLECEEGTVIEMPEPSKDGYTFAYWQGSKYYAGDSYTVTGNHEFKAIWNKKPDSDNFVFPKTGVE
ncbi:MAG: carbohydrate-binding domain-containing protein [Erysipelotrichaceae bacterium]|nr:carbohydrate-binding domain-containing protein [Erysipelotrichaceae bacterium]